MLKILLFHVLLLCFLFIFRLVFLNINNNWRIFLNNILACLIMVFFLFQSLSGNHSERSTISLESRGMADTLSIGLDDTVNIGFAPGDVMLEVFQAPGDLSLHGVGLDISQWNTDGSTPSLKVEVFRPGTVGYPYLSTGDMYELGAIDENGWIGYAHPGDNDSISHPDINSATGLTWNSFSNETGTCASATEVMNGQPVLGPKVLPTGDDVLVTRPADGSTGLFLADFSSGGSTQFSEGENIAVAITYMPDDAGDPANENSVIHLNAGDASNLYPAPGLKYYGSGCSGPSGEHGWHIMSSTWKFQYSVTIWSDIGPTIDIYHVGMSSTTGLPESVPPWEEVNVFAIVNDSNPAGGDEGVEIVGLHWQRNSLTADTNSIAMSELYNLVIQQYVYHKKIEGYGNGTIIYWWISAQDVEGNISTTNKRSYIIGTLSTEDEMAPSGFSLGGNYPNPFNPVTNIYYTIDTFSELNITIYDVLGKQVRNLFQGKVGPGNHSIYWNGKDQAGAGLPTGVYFYRLESKGRYLFGKMMLLQ